MREGMTLTLAWLEARMSEIVSQRQWAWENAEYEPERWFASLRFVSAQMSDAAATFLFVDEHGQRFGYRWPLRREEDGWSALADPEESLDLFDAHLMEDVDTTRPGEPDKDGVRWFGDS